MPPKKIAKTSSSQRQKQGLVGVPIGEHSPTSKYLHAMKAFSQVMRGQKVNEPPELGEEHHNVTEEFRRVYDNFLQASREIHMYEPPVPDAIMDTLNDAQTQYAAAMQRSSESRAKVAALANQNAGASVLDTSVRMTHPSLYNDGEKGFCKSQNDNVENFNEYARRTKFSADRNGWEDPF